MRKPRKLVAGARYHVSARVNHQEMLLDDEGTKHLFIDTVKRAKAKYDFRIDNFTIMGNHFHLILQPLNGANLSEIMKWIIGVFAMAYNRIHGIQGHLWQGRFFSRVVATLRDLRDLFDYIDANPIKAGLVSSGWDWRYGGLAHHREYRREIVAPLLGCLRILFPAHSGLLLPYRDADISP